MKEGRGGWEKLFARGGQGSREPLYQKEGRVDFRNNAKGRQRDSKIP